MVTSDSGSGMLAAAYPAQAEAVFNFTGSEHLFGSADQFSGQLRTAKNITAGRAQFLSGSAATSGVPVAFWHDRFKFNNVGNVINKRKRLPLADKTDTAHIPPP